MEQHYFKLIEYFYLPLSNKKIWLNSIDTQFSII
jgi:hypothetical protein